MLCVFRTKLSNFTAFSQQTRCSTGVVKASVGDFTSAIQLFTKVLELNPSHEAASKHITEARVQQMNQRQAGQAASSNQSHSRAQRHRVDASNSSHKRTSR